VWRLLSLEGCDTNGSKAAPETPEPKGRVPMSQSVTERLVVESLRTTRARAMHRTTGERGVEAKTSTEFDAECAPRLATASALIVPRLRCVRSLIGFEEAPDAAISIALGAMRPYVARDFTMAANIDMTMVGGKGILSERHITATKGEIALYRDFPGMREAIESRAFQFSPEFRALFGIEDTAGRPFGATRAKDRSA